MNWIQCVFVDEENEEKEVAAIASNLDRIWP